MNLKGDLIVRPIKADLVKDIAWFTKMDPYLKITVGHQTFITKYHDNGGKQPSWNEEFHFKVNGDKTMEIEIFDKNTFKDKQIGFIKIPIREISIGQHK